MDESNKRNKTDVIDIEQPPQKKQQTSIGAYFGLPNTKIVEKQPIKKAKAGSSGSSSKIRTLQVGTAEKWKTTSLAKYDADNWLIIDADEKNKLVKTLRCSICSKYEHRITSVKGFQETWCREGSKRLQHAAAVEHAEGNSHGVAYDLYLKNKGLSARERTEKLKETVLVGGQEGIVHGIDVMNLKDFELTKKKFETAYFVAKEELPLSTFSKLLCLEERHGVEMGTAYRNRNYGGKMMDYVSESLSNELKQELSNAHFYSVLTDGSTDASVCEKEAIFAIHFNPSPEGSDQVKIVTSYVDLVDLKNANSRGIIEGINNAFEGIGVSNYMEKLVGFGSDGASVNSGKKEGVKTLLQEENEWITFGWCVAHRLELALKDSLKGTGFADVDEMILNLYYLYKKSPKKLRQLKELVSLYDDFEFNEGGFRPKKASGTILLILE